MLSRQVVLVFGPPGAGKSTLARELAATEGLEVFDRDDPGWSGERHFTGALRRVGRSRFARAVVIRSGATRSARGKAVALVDPTEVRLLQTSLAECERNVKSRGRSVRSELAAVRAWFARFEPGEPVLPVSRAKPRRSASARGYGSAHKAIRRRWLPQVEAGVVNCARCGLPIVPGEPWDLGHDDHDRTRYWGPEHRKCNRSTAGRRPRKREPVGKSRVW